MRRWWWRAKALLASGLIGALGTALCLTAIGFEFERELGLSWLFAVRGPVEPPSDVAIVAIDGTTGAALGLPRMPREWPRAACRTA